MYTCSAMSMLDRALTATALAGDSATPGRAVSERTALARSMAWPSVTELGSDDCGQKSFEFKWGGRGGRITGLSVRSEEGESVWLHVVGV